MNVVSRHSSPSPRLARVLGAATALALAGATLTACTGADAESTENPNYTTEASDAFPVTVEHDYGKTVIPAEPQRIVVVGLTEQDILLELGVTPIATTEWYGEQPYAVWPWATELLGDAEPVVLDATDGFEYEKIASLTPDLIIGTNAGMSEESYEKLSEIAPTVTSKEDADVYFEDWQEQTRQIAQAVGRSTEGEALITEVEDAYAAAAAEHPEFAGLTASFAQGGAYEGNIWVYPDGMNTDFLTDLGFTITPGLEQYSPQEGQQALISGENMSVIDADVIVFATENAESIQSLLDFGTTSKLDAVTGGRAIFTDDVLAGAIYFLTPLSQKYVLDKLVPRLVDAVNGEAAQSIDG